ncbi:MAG: hypothetical protein AAF927_31695 [Bacteroidota bacterium]
MEGNFSFIISMLEGLTAEQRLQLRVKLNELIKLDEDASKATVEKIISEMKEPEPFRNEWKSVKE